MISSSNNISSHFHSDRVLLWSLRFLSLLAGGLLLLIVLFLFQESWPTFRHVGLSSFYNDIGKHREDLYLLTPMLWGTVWATLGSVLLAAPLGILSALFIQYYAPPSLATWYRRLIELLAGIPSVVFGLWGLVVLVPLIARWHPPVK